MTRSAGQAAAIDIVVATLAPYLGENMARAAVRGQRDKLKLGPDLPGRELDLLLEAMGPGLSVFVGREKTKEIAAAIRAAVGNGAAS